MLMAFLSFPPMACGKRGLACTEQPCCRALILLPVSVSASTWKSLSPSLSPNELQSELGVAAFAKVGGWRICGRVTET